MDELIDKGKRVALSGWPMVLAWVGMLIFALHASSHMVGAGDTWVAMACGRHFTHYGVDTIEPFSANSHHAGPTEEDVKKWPTWAQQITEKVGLETVRKWHPTGWLNQNWLTHVIFYNLTPKSSYDDGLSYTSNALVYWKFAIYILTVICVYYTGRLLGVNPALSAVFACFSMFVARSFLDIRPAGFSNLMVAVFLLVLALTTYRNILYIWLVVPVTVFWCNVHGGYIYVFIMLIPFIGLHLMINLPKKWTAILYNLGAWPFFFVVASRINLEKLTQAEQGQAYLGLFLLFIFLLVMDYVLIFAKEKLVTIKWRGLYHTIAAGLAAFAAAVIFNPFHLTNMTHTFIISVSEHAKMWRSVNEWHPAFAWQNPVGTGFPFLILFILSIGLSIFWLFSRRLIPKSLKLPRDEFERQEGRFDVLCRILGFATAIFLTWVVFISLSFVEADILSFILCAAFIVILLLSICKNIHFIYLMVALCLVAMKFSKADANYDGRYIFGFLILPAYFLLHIFVSLFSKKIKFKRITIAFVALAAVFSVLLMCIIFKPFKFEMPFGEMSFGKALEQIWELRRPWKSTYEKNLGLSYTHLFKTLYIVNIASAALWLFLPYLKEKFAQLFGKAEREQEVAESQEYQLPRIDLTLIIIAALTIYMAYRSRRFITIAAFAACPFVAMFIDQIIRAIGAANNFYKRNSLTVPPMACSLRKLFVILGIGGVLVFGIGWGLKFKRVYLDFWPTDTKLNSIFIRMTASNVKPFYACKFMRDNKMTGKMFNYWTEGGFIAWGQNPDPNTGKTPLQLFMDGRAQAAYEPDVYQLWSGIMSGGQIAAQIVQSARMRKKKVSIADYKKIGKWVSNELRKHDVWVVLMPAGEFNKPMVKGLEYDTDWQIAFMNNKQKMFVDVKTAQGKELFNGIFSGRTVFPDEFSKKLVLANNAFLVAREESDRDKAFTLALEAFELNPSQAATQVIVASGRFPHLKPRVEEFCKSYIQKFEQQKEDISKTDGYHHRTVAASIACAYLRQQAARGQDIELSRHYESKKRDYDKELQILQKRKRW